MIRYAKLYACLSCFAFAVAIAPLGVSALRAADDSSPTLSTEGTASDEAVVASTKEEPKEPAKIVLKEIQQGKEEADQKAEEGAAVSADDKTNSAQAAVKPTDDSAAETAVKAPEKQSTSETADAPKKTAPKKTDVSRKDADESAKPAEEKTNETNSDAKEGASKESKKSAAAKPAKPKRQLTPAMTELRDQVRQTLAFHHRQPLNSQQNTVSEVINFCWAYGCFTEMTLNDANGERRVNGVTCLCWNYPCGGFYPLMMSQGHVSAGLGYGLQMRPSQLLATLAVSRVQATYPVRVGETTRNVADLVESEKLSCRAGSDLSMKLIGLSYYVGDATWKNDLGEEWSVERLVKEELKQPVLSAPDGGNNRLFALSFAIARRERRDQPVVGIYADAQKYLREMQKFSYNLQNSDGSWGFFLSARGANADFSLQLRSTAYITEWLTLAASEDRLEDPRLVAAVTYLTNGLNSQRYRTDVSDYSTQEIEGVMRAVHALALYDEREFKPTDVAKPAVDPKQDSTESAQRQPVYPQTTAR